MMRVYIKNGNRDAWGNPRPIVIETNINWALPYWQHRKKINPDLYWTIS
jgi:hypothetical protein